MRSKFTGFIKAKTTIFTLACLFLLISMTSTVVPAATYTAYVLPILQGNNYTSVHDKVTSDNKITNVVTAITDASFANFWAVNVNNSQISGTYKQGVGTGTASIQFTSSGYNVIGQQVGMGMENYNSSLTRGFVSGNVDFR